jgi:hypothetical protein
MVAKSMDVEFLTEGQLENRGIASRRTLQGWRLRGSGPRYYKLGGMVKYRWSDVEDWLNARSVSPRPTQPPDALKAGR